MGARGWLAWLAAVAVAACFGWAAQADAFVYWANQGTNTVGRANLDGTGANQSFITGASSPRGVAVDAGHVYWTNAGTGTIGRANVDGTGADQGFITGATSPAGVAVDTGHVYWANFLTGTIGRANVDGSGANQSFIPAPGAISSPMGVAVDAGHVYWTNQGTNTVGRANVDGSGANQSFITGASGPAGVAVDGGPPGSASASPASLSFGGQPVGVFGPPRSVTITNGGHGNLEIDAARLTGGDVADFQVSDDGCSQTTLEVGATCTVQVRFGPTADGDRRATLALTSNDPASPLRIALEARGELPQVPAVPPGPTVPPVPVAPAPQGGAEPAIAGLRLASRCVRPSRSGRVRVRLSMRLARPGPVRVRIDRGVGTRALRRCPRPNPGRRFTGSFHRVATLRRTPTEPAAAAVDRRLTLKLRLAPGLYRISVRAQLDGNRLSRPARRYLRVLAR